MTYFIEVHDTNDGKATLLNVKDISRIEEHDKYTLIYLRETADDFDGSRHQVKVLAEEGIDYFRRGLKLAW